MHDSRSYQHLNNFQETKEANQTIRNLFDQNKNFLVGKLGSNECVLLNHNETGMVYPDHLIQQFRFNAGIVPTDKKSLDTIANLLRQSLSRVDVFSPWNTGKNRGEENLVPKYTTSCQAYVRLRALDPVGILASGINNPWSQKLENKRVLIVSPFKDSVLSQYENRYKWDVEQKILPNLQSLLVLKTSFTSDADSLNGFEDWRKQYKIYSKFIEDNQDNYDIALVGCGAMGLPLAAQVKDLGKTAIHMGGSLQLLFGILGGRWENKEGFNQIFNDHWIRPMEHERPENFAVIAQQDGGGDSCYF